MKTSTRVFVMGVAGCFSSALLHAAFLPIAAGADSSTSLSLLQQSSVTEAASKAQASGTAPIVVNPGMLALNAQKGQTAVGTLTLRKSSSDQHTYYLSTNQSWVWMNPPYGSTQTITSETDQLVITAQTAGLATGTYSAVVYIVDSGPNNFTNMLRVPVSLTVTATSASATPPPPVVTPPSPPPAAPTPPPVALTPPPATPAAVTPPPAQPTVASSVITATPSALALTAVKGQTAVGTLALRKGGTDQHSYYLSTNQSWVWMNPPYGSTQTITTETDQLVITAQTASLSPGTYSAVIYVGQSGPNNFSNMLRVPITLTVTAATATPSQPTKSPVTPPPPPPVAPTPVPTPVVITPPPPPPAPPAPTPSVTSPIVVSPASMALTGTNNVGTLTLRKAGTDQHVYSLSASQSWIWMNPPYGSTQTISSETDQIVVTAQTSGLAAGTYSGVVYIVDSGPNNYSNTIRVPVTFTIAANQPAAAPAQTNPAPSQPVTTTPPSPPPATPTPVGGVSPSPAPTPSRTASATVTWSANTEADLAGYRVYVGTTSGTYTFAGPFETSGTSFTVPNLPVGTTYYFAVSAFDKAGNESTKSGEVSKSVF